MISRRSWNAESFLDRVRGVLQEHSQDHGTECHGVKNRITDGPLGEPDIDELTARLRRLEAYAPSIARQVELNPKLRVAIDSARSQRLRIPTV